MKYCEQNLKSYKLQKGWAKVEEMSEFSKKSLNPWISNNFIQKVSPTDKVTSRDADASKKHCFVTSVSHKI